MTAGTASRLGAQAPPGPRGAELRGDIEGLRAIAVLMVLLYHAGVPGLSGGFAGVDVFFVISGYLITNLLVKEATRDGRISIPRFYARRARRLLPAATLVLVVTSLAGWWLLPRGRHAELGTDILGATGYVVNWVFAHREVDYLAEDADPSLVQHYWSLSVEEQFYVVWPMLIILVLWAAHRFRLRLVPLLTIALGTVVVASLAWSVVHTAESPGTAYFASTTRVWQLGTGGLLVLLTPALRLMRPRFARTLAWAGLACIGATIILISTSTPWPGSAALLPTLGTAAVIAAGITAPGNPAARLLGVRPMRFLGALSYGLYLWHWPALRLLVETHPEASLLLRLAVAGLSVLLAWATLRLVEDPIRFHPGLSGRPSRALGLGAVAMLTSASLGATLLLTAPRLETTSAGSGPGALALVDPASRSAEQLRMTGDPAAAVAHVDELTPDPAVIEEDLSVAYRDGCQVNLTGTELVPEAECSYGDPDGDVVVALVGDSKMEQWSSALHAIGAVEGWRIQVYTKSGCGLVDEGRDDSCHAYNRMLVDHLSDPEHAPDIVMTSAGSGYSGLAGSMSAMLQPILDAGAKLVVLADTPTPQPRGVADEVTTYECLDLNREDWTPCWSDPRPAPGDAVLPEVSERLGGTYVDLGRWICPEPALLGGCAPVVGGVVVNRQGSHLSASFVRSLTPLLHHELVVQGVATTPLDQIPWVVAEDPPES